MAGASMNDIKARIKSVNCTMQITKAMELVATSKLRRAKERAERSRPYHDALSEAISTLRSSSEVSSSIWAERRESAKTLFVVIAGDRGLAGGYNANIFRLTDSLSKDKDSLFLPIGKKAIEYYRHRKRELFTDSLSETADVGVGDSLSVSDLITEGFLRGDFGEVVLVYTKFVSMLTQTPVYETILPLTKEDTGRKTESDPIFEADVEEMLQRIVPEYIGGMIYSAVCEAQASESGARRSAMNAANKNATEMIDDLSLKYNRARQSVITQEITEIVSGAEAL